METALKERLWQYISSHNPELMYELQEEYRVSAYLEEKISAMLPEVEYLLNEGVPALTVQEICIEQMTEELKPSKFLFIKRILEEEFPTTYEVLQQSYLLNYEVLNIMDCCKDIFEKFGFEEQNGIQRSLRYAIIGEIDHYLS